jgi:uncharacterized protein YkwD
MKTFFIFLILTVLTSCGKNSDSISYSPTAGAPGNQSETEIETQYLKLVNDYRRSMGLNSLSYSAVIQVVALEHSVHMSSRIGRFGHGGWRNCCRVLRQELNSTACAEIVAMG